jgi:hypothetical protein
MKLVLPMSFENYRRELSARGVDASLQAEKLLHLELVS